MNGIPRAKRLQVAQYYLLGHPYGEIVEKTGISHGSVANVVKDKAVVGEKLGNLENVIFKLKQEKLVYLGLPVAKPDSSKEQNFK